MTHRAYYNEIDPDKAAWLGELMRAGAITEGEVDERSIHDVAPADLLGFTRCHFFAGIGVWDYALQLARWPLDEPVWTGSCPCPSFSVAGKGEGFADPRHLWPVWFGLIRQCRPRTVFGEQADGAIGHGWLDLVSADLEAEGYAFAAAVLGAHSVGAPHRRQRLYFGGTSCQQPVVSGAHAGRASRPAEQQHQPRRESRRQASPDESLRVGADGRTGSDHDAFSPRLEGHGGDVREWRGPGWLDPLAARSVAASGATRGFWADCDWWYGRDGKYRPAGPGISPLAHGAAARVVRLRGYGDAITAQTAQAFLESWREATDQWSQR